jgi:hypothetical protein
MWKVEENVEGGMWKVEENVEGGMWNVETGLVGDSSVACYAPERGGLVP